MTGGKGKQRMKKPLTDEQIWGEPDRPEQAGPETKPKDSCPYQECRCMFWDQGCQAIICVKDDWD